MSLVCFVLACYCWARDLPLRVIYMPGETPLKKSNFSYASACRLELASEPFSAGTPSGLNVYRPSECCHDFCAFMHPLVVLSLEGTVFFVSFFLFGSNSPFVSSYMRFLSPERRNFMETSNLGLSSPRSISNLFII